MKAWSSLTQYGEGVRMPIVIAENFFIFSVDLFASKIEYCIWLLFQHFNIWLKFREVQSIDMALEVKWGKDKWKSNRSTIKFFDIRHTILKDNALFCSARFCTMSVLWLFLVLEKFKKFAVVRPSIGLEELICKIGVWDLQIHYS